MNKNEKKTKYIESEISIYDEKEAQFQNLSSADNFNYDFNNYVHLI
ncbi:conserved Plasmodium protein, unknown function, partial [Plasmodium relictum]